MLIVRVGLAAIAGVCTYIGFVPHFWALAIIGIALFAWALDGSTRGSRVLYALTFAAGLYGPLIRWLNVVSLPGTFGLLLLCVLPWTLFILYVPSNSHIKSAARIASLVVLIEAIHSNIPWGGFPWGLLAYSQIDGPFIGISRVGGEVLTTAVVVVAGYLLFALVRQRAMAIVGFTVAAVVVSQLMLLQSPIEDSVRVAVIQGNVPRFGLSMQEQAEKVFTNHIKQTHQLAADIASGKVDRPDLVVWPENAADGDPVNNRAMFDQVQSAVDDVNAPVLIGAAVWDGEVGPYNAGILWLPTVGPSQRYEKQHLVPFGEYIPHRNILEDVVRNFGPISHSFVAGTDTGIIDYHELLFADVICFEVAYDEHIRSGVNSGAKFITVQSNNATYALTEQPLQQLQITRFRAIEHGRSFAVATTTGFSALIDSRGEVLAKSKEMEPATLTGVIQQHTIRQPIDRWGSGVWVALAGFVLLASLRKESGWKSKRSRNMRFGRVK